jgi:hypothetical protein
MRIVAVITQAPVIDQILTHLRTRAFATAAGGVRGPVSPERWIAPPHHPHGDRRSDGPRCAPTGRRARR